MRAENRKTTNDDDKPDKHMSFEIFAKRLFSSRGFAFCACMFEFGVDFTADQNDKSADVHPGQQHDDCADTAVGLVV